MTRVRQASAVLVALAVACSVLAGPVGVVAAQSSVTVTQTAQGATTVNPGDSITIDVTIETEESGSPAIELNGVPAGWTINAINNDGGDYNPSNYEWFWLGDSNLNGNYTHTVTYEVTVPTDASDGTYQIDAIGSSQGDEGVDDDYEETDTLSITVEEENTPPTASFTVSPTNPATGQTVTFDASGSSDDDSITSYKWDFDGDGTVDQTTSSSSITHSFGSAGSYDVELTVEDNDQASDSTTNTVDVSDTNTAPTASFTVSPTNPATGQTVTFDASGSSDDSSIASYEWDFDGDGTVDQTTSSSSITHSYGAADSYDVELTVTDDEGKSDSTTTTVDVSQAQGSSVSVSQTPGSTTVNPGDSITVDVSIDTTNSGSPAIELEGVPAGWTINAIDNDGGDYNANNYEWFWLSDSDLNGDYSHTITYEVTVPSGASDGSYAIDAVGSSQGDEGVDDDYQDTDTLSITVQSQQQNQPPTASFTVSPTNPETGQTVTFDASGSSDDSSIASYEWDFDGDGTVDQTTNSPTVTHSYGAAGSYDVELTVTDDEGESDSTTTTVDVSQAQGSSVSVEQTAQGSTTVAPGDSITVDVSIDTTNSGAPAIELEDVPAGWQIDAIDNDGGNFNANNDEWFWQQDSDLNGDYSHTITYEVTVPSGASDGSYAIDAVGSSQGDEGVDDDYQDTDTLSISVQGQPGAPSATLTITPNSGIEASAYNTGSFTIENTGGQNIESVTIDLSSTTFPDVVFDPEGTAGDMGAKGLDIDSQSGDGVGVVSTADADVFSQPHNGVDGSDGYDVMTIEFTDFEPGETLMFSVDNDPTSIKGATIQSQEAGPISGLELARATVTVDYAGGASQTTQAIGDGSDGGAVAVADTTVPDAPIFTVDGPNFDYDALDSQHRAAKVSDANQTITVSGQSLESDDTVKLVQVEGELVLDNVPAYDGTPGYEIEDYEANDAVNVEYYQEPVGPSGDVDIPVTLTESSEVGGLNYFVAAEVDAEGAGLSSRVAVLKYEPTPNEGSLTFSDQPLEADGTVSVENVSTGQASTVVVTYTNASGAVIVAGTASADDLDEEDVPVAIQDAGGFPGEHTAWVFDDADLEGLDLGPGDDVLAATGLSASGVQDLALDSESAEVTLPPIEGFANPPTDPDGDGKYEDLNGDGDVNVGDAQAIFANAQDPVVVNNAPLFDFNGDGDVNVGDAQALFARGVGA